MSRHANPAVEDAIKGIRANFLPRRVMVFDRNREWGGAIAKAGGEVWIIGSNGEIHRSADQAHVRTSL